LNQLEKYIGWKLRIVIAVSLLIGSIIFFIKGYSFRSSGETFSQYWVLALLMLWGSVSQISPAITNYSNTENNPK